MEESDNCHNGRFVNDRDHMKLLPYLDLGILCNVRLFVDLLACDGNHIRMLH